MHNLVLIYRKSLLILLFYFLFLIKCLQRRAFVLNQLGPKYPITWNGLTPYFLHADTTVGAQILLDRTAITIGLELK